MPGRLGDLPKELRNHALGQVIGGEAVFHSHFSQADRQPPVPADDRFAQAVHGQMIQPPLAAVALPGGKHHLQIPEASCPSGLLESRHNGLRVHQPVSEAPKVTVAPL